MTIHWVSLAIVVALLGFPAPLSREVNRRLGNPTRGPAVRLTRMTGLLVNWVDLLRGMVGGLLLEHLAVEANPQVAGAAQRALLVQGAVLIACLLPQVIRFRKEFIFLAPVFYLGGITLALPPWDAGLAALVVGCGFALATKTVGCLLPVTSVVLAIYGYFLDGLNLSVILTSGLLFLPVIVSLMFLKDLRYVSAKANWSS